MRRFASLVLLILLAGCGATATDAAGPAAFDPGSVRIGGSHRHRTQVMRDVTAIIEGMEGARLSRLRRAGP